MYFFNQVARARSEKENHGSPNSRQTCDFPMTSFDALPLYLSMTLRDAQYDVALSIIPYYGKLTFHAINVNLKNSGLFINKWH